MSFTYRCIAGVFAGLLALFVLKALGVPFWRQWDIGDQCDGFIVAWALTLMLTLPADGALGRHDYADEPHDMTKDPSMTDAARGGEQ